MNKQLLIVDDSPEIHSLIIALLAEEPVDVQSASDPALGLTLAASMKPDLILLDVDMPIMDGYEFCRQMKADPVLWTVPVVFLTSKSDVDQKVRGLELGAVDYITKPFSPGELLARVRGALRTQSVINDLADNAYIDSLTGLGNRKMFVERLRGEVSERSRSLKPLSCTYIAVDGFQMINHHYGSPFGDLVLKKVGEAIREVYRPEDVACRLRDENFALLMPDTPQEMAIAMARDVKARLTHAAFMFRSSRIPVTCSIGIAEALEPYDHSVFDRAVGALDQSPEKKSDAFAVWNASAPVTVDRAA